MITTPYDSIAEEFAAMRSSLQPKEREYLSVLLDHLPPGSLVLDLGCGTGRPIAGHIASLGHRIVGVDASRTMLDLARKALPDHQWLHARLEAIDFEADRFAAVVCWDSLFHLPRNQHAPVLRKIHRWLAPCGRLMLSSGARVEEDGSGFTDTMFGHEFYYDSLTPVGLDRALADIGFTTLVSEICTPPDGGRDKGKRATITAKGAI